MKKLHEDDNCDIPSTMQTNSGTGQSINSSANIELSNQFTQITSCNGSKIIRTASEGTLDFSGSNLIERSTKIAKIKKAS